MVWWLDRLGACGFVAVWICRLVVWFVGGAAWFLFCMFGFGICLGCYNMLLGFGVCVLWVGVCVECLRWWGECAVWAVWLVVICLLVCGGRRGLVGWFWGCLYGWPGFLYYVFWFGVVWVRRGTFLGIVVVLVRCLVCGVVLGDSVWVSVWLLVL